MILLDNKEIEVRQFSDGTQRVNVPENYNPFTGVAHLKWKYESDSELVTLQYLTMYLKDMYPTLDIGLTMLYAPNARMDRIENKNEIFTLKYFSQIINSLNFSRVTIFDTHSRVTDALINRARIISPDDYIHNVKKDILWWRDGLRGNIPDSEKFIYFFPDKGAYDKYKKLKSVTTNCAGVLYGEKYRNWETCDIERFEVHGNDGEVSSGNFDIPVLIIDDIISSGETVVRSIESLKVLGFKNIFVFCSHLENRFDTDKDNKLRKMLEDGEIKKLYTTDSIYSGKTNEDKTKNVVKIYA